MSILLLRIMNQFKLEIPLEQGIHEHVRFDASGIRYRITTTVTIDGDKQFLRVMNDYPDIQLITQSTNKKVKNVIGELCYTESSFLLNMTWLYSMWYQYNVIVFLPSSIKNIDLFTKKIDFVPDYYLLNGNLESLSSFDSIIAKFKNPRNKLVVLFGYTELIFKEIVGVNKRRLNTILKKIIKRASIVNFLSVTDIKIFDLDSINDSCECYRLKSIPEVNLGNFINYSNFIDLYDYNNELDVSIITELIVEKVNESKRVFISLDTEISILRHIFNELTSLGIDVNTNDNPDSQVVINSSIKTQKNYLVNEYNIFIISTPLIFDSVDVICYLNLILHKSPEIEVYLDSSKMKNILKNIKKITSVPTKPEISYQLKLKDSSLEFDTYHSCVESVQVTQNPVQVTEYQPSVQVTEYYFKIEKELLPKNITKINLSNVTKEEYSIIRNHVKFFLENKIGTTIDTCQLTTPSSPKDRYKKLNSLSTKICSYDYRCEVTCEIFKDHSIGIIVWNELFGSKKTTFNLQVGDSFIYQTTSGKWKYSVVV